MLSDRSVTNPAGRPSPSTNGATPFDAEEDGADTVLVSIMLRLDIVPDMDIVLWDITMEEAEVLLAPADIDIIDELDED